MDTQTPGTPSQNTTPVMPTMPPTEKKSVGAAIGIIIIVIVLVLGGLYFWGKTLEEGGQSLDQAESDLNNNDVDALEQDLGELDAEVEAL